MAHNFYQTLKTFTLSSQSSSKTGQFYSLPQLGAALNSALERLPRSLRIVLESVLRHYDGEKITEQHILQLAKWQPNAQRVHEIPFVVSRVLLQDFTGVPLLVDLAAMRTVAQRLKKNPKAIEPTVLVDLVIDHSVQVDHFREDNALELNMQIEFKRNQERYQFMKWGMQAFDNFRVIQPGFGIVHQVNLEYLARTLYQKQGVYYPDSLVGTDSHTTMIGGAGVVAWGVGGIEAEAAMLGQPVYFLTPDVIGVELKGQLRGGITATDLVLKITEILRQEKVVGKFVEFFGEGAAHLSVPDRATIANMAPEYGATIGYFSVDEKTVDYFEKTARRKEDIDAFVQYYQAQQLFGTPLSGEIDYSKVIVLDLATIAPSLAGPKRPQDRIDIAALKEKFTQLLTTPSAHDGYNLKPKELKKEAITPSGIKIRQGDVLIAAITSCTNTSNPHVLIAAGLLAKKAVEAGLRVAVHIKTSLAPGSRVVTDYLKSSNLLSYLEQLGFRVVAYGCTTCIGNSGDLAPEISNTLIQNDLIGAAVLSGNRNFEARIHPNIRANFLASPPLVVAYALAGTMMVDLMTEPVGHNAQGDAVYLGDIWPSEQEIAAIIAQAIHPQLFSKRYAVIQKPNNLWDKIQGSSGDIYAWPPSTYIAEPPFFKDFQLQHKHTIQPIVSARALAIFGDSLTTDHISPAGAIKENAPAGEWLKAQHIVPLDFNSYGSRRGHHEVMMRGTFANVRIKNLMLTAHADGSVVEGGFTLYQPDQHKMSIYDAALRYQKQHIPTIVFGGEEYGTGSSRDWAAKGTLLLGVKAVIAKSFERIHRSNLIGMGVLPLQFKPEDSVHSLGISGNESFSIEGLDDTLKPKAELTLIIQRASGETQRVNLLVRIDTPIELDYYQQGGILPYVLRQLLLAA